MPQARSVTGDAHSCIFTKKKMKTAKKLNRKAAEMQLDGQAVPVVTHVPLAEHHQGQTLSAGAPFTQMAMVINYWSR